MRDGDGFFSFVTAVRPSAVVLAVAMALGIVGTVEAATSSGDTTQTSQQPSVWDELAKGKALAAGEGVAKDTAKARQIFERLMTSDDAAAAGAAAYALASLAKDDLKDPALATRALERGIALGEPWSMVTRAQALAAGSPKEQKQAVDLYLRAVAASQDREVQSTAFYGLGQLYLTPALLSGKLALDYYRRAAELGNDWSLIAIGGIYENGTGTKKNWTSARDAYQKALDAKDPEVKGYAAYALARLYSQPAHNAPKRVFDYLKTAEASGIAWANMMLADRYLNGIGVKKNADAAIRIYTEVRSGTDEGASKAAAFQLGKLYSSGRTRNLKLAEENFSFAAGLGDVWSAYFLAQLYLKDMPGKANRRKARDLLNTVAASDDATARSSAKALLKTIR